MLSFTSSPSCSEELPPLHLISVGGKQPLDFLFVPVQKLHVVWAVDTCLFLFVSAVNIFPIKESNFRVRFNLWKCISETHIKVQDEGDESGQEECMSLALTVM